MRHIVTGFAHGSLYVFSTAAYFVFRKYHEPCRSGKK